MSGIKQKLKICHVCQFPRPLWISSPPTCKSCASGLKSRSIAKIQTTLTQTIDGREAKPFRVIKKVSDKQAKLNRAYIAQNKVYLKFNPVCQAGLKGCTGKSTEVHHKKGRGQYLLDETTWLACCRNCHSWCELNPEQAKEIGLSLDRLP